MSSRADPRDRLSALVRQPEAAGEIAVAEIPGLLALLAGLQAALVGRLVVEWQDRRDRHVVSAPVAADPDRLLTAEQAAPILGVAARYLYRHAGKLPFTRRLSSRVLRFSEVGLRRYVATRRA